MRRGLSGDYRVRKTGEESVRAFVPLPLPPRPLLDIEPTLRESLDQAHLALGRLDSVYTLLPETPLFLYMYVRKEAVVSSQIEGTQSSLSDLLLFELDEAPGIPLEDILEVSNYVKALYHGLARLKDLPLSNRLIREVHGILIKSGRGSDKQPGEFRRSQNWIGGTRPGNAFFVPPPEDRVPELMADLEKFLHDIPERTPPLIKAALAHVQFETIHPFLDGNGRVGRLLIPLILCREGILQKPLLYLSLYLKQNRTKYFDLLTAVRLEGVWEEWLAFFIAGVREMAEGAVATARRLAAIAAEDRDQIRSLGRLAGTVLRIHQTLQKRPMESIPSLAKQTKLSQPAVTRAIDALQKTGIIKEITGRKRNRLYVYVRYLDILRQGTER